MRTIYRAGILTAALMVLVLGGCSGFDRGGEEMASAAGRGADARLGLDAGQGPNAVIKEGGQGKEGLEKKPEKIYSMQIGHSQPVDNPRHQSFLLFKKLLEEKTDGGIQVDIYPAGQLGSEASMLEQVCDGTIQGFRGGQLEIVPRMLVFSLPFLCEDRTQAERGKLRICQGNKHGFPEKRSHHIGNRRCGRIPAVFQQRADDPQAGGSERA